MGQAKRRGTYEDRVKQTLENCISKCYKRIEEAKELSDPHGCIFGPTGVGKGEVISHMVDITINKDVKKQINIAVTVSHRILLSMQLSHRTVKKSLLSGKVHYNRVAVHSGDANDFSLLDGDIEREIVNSHSDTQILNSTDLIDHISRSIIAGENIAISTTYHSLDTVSIAMETLGLESNLTQGDEIHHLKNDKWYNKMERLLKISRRSRGYTATPGKCRQRLEKLFGKTIWEMSAKEAQDIGLITKPIWFTTEVDGNHENYLDQAVVESFIKREKDLNVTQKMLVHCGHSWEISTCIDPKNRIWTELKTCYEGLMIAAIASHSEIQHYIDGVKYTNRQEWLDTINAHKGRLIVFHIDIVNSGIDVPGFTTSLWTRPPVSEIRQTQGNGRSRRIDSLDREKLEQGIISGLDRETGWIKPYNYEGVLFFNDILEDDINKFTDTVIASREEGFDPEDINFSNSSSRTGTSEEQDIDTPTQAKIKAQIKHKMEELKKTQQKQKQSENTNSWLTSNETFEDKLKNIEVNYV